jgi:hypothetical protein
MATNTTTDTSLDKVAALLGIGSNELDSLLNEEFKAISADAIESKRHPSFREKFIQFALEKIDELAADQKYFPILKKIIHRDEPRRFYFYQKELEAIGRILFFIENNGLIQLSLVSLDLFTLPPLLRRTRNLQRLDISNNNLQDISMITDLPDLQVLLANNNQISYIEFLRSDSMPTLKELQLAGNRINDSRVKPILENPYLEKVMLADNPINAPLDMLNDIVALRKHFGTNHSSPARTKASTTVTATTTASPTPNTLNETHKQSVEETTTSEPNPEGKAPEQEQTVVEEESVKKAGAASNKNRPESKTHDASKEKQYVSYSTRDIHLRGNPRDNLLDIEKLSSIFYNLIANSDSSGEHFFGLFGRWGRGKTFFWKYILEKRLDREKYIPIEFHAWKYQDTPGIWAYLYNTLNDAYLGDKPKWHQLVKWAKYYKKILILNGKRGKLPILVGFLVSLLIAVGVYVYNDLFKGSETLQTILRVGIPISFISMLVYIAKKFKTDARKIMLALTSNVNFNNHLGFQHEIQQELKYLLQAWIPEKHKFNKRIFLFIDDVDRCSENKIIQIVDYIRVLLHCPAIQDRVTVLAAIDERILLHAIQVKYKEFIANKDNDATYKELCREYMDKLFLAGLKLGPLTVFEKRQIVEGFTGMDTAETDDAMLPATNGIKSTKVAEIISHTDNKEPVTEKHATVAKPGDVKVVIPDGGMQSSEPVRTDTSHVQSETVAIKVEPIPIASTARKEFPYEKWEQEFIKDILALNTESTPRSIRVYTYRYLLGKQLVEKSLIEGKIAWSQWFNTKEAKQCFAIKLMHYGFKSDTEHLLSDYRNFISEYDENSSFKESIYGHEISLNQELGSIMFQVLTMIIAY